MNSLTFNQVSLLIPCALMIKILFCNITNAGVMPASQRFRRILQEKVPLTANLSHLCVCVSHCTAFYLRVLIPVSYCYLCVCVYWYRSGIYELELLAVFKLVIIVTTLVHYYYFNILIFAGFYLFMRLFAVPPDHFPRLSWQMWLRALICIFSSIPLIF